MAQMRMREEAARDLLLVRAIETEDAGAVVLTQEDRRYSTSAALASTGLGEAEETRDRSAFLARRAELALGRLTARYPALERVRQLASWPHWLSWGLPLAALVIGMATNAVEGRQLNILAFPLLGMLAWNAMAYAWLLVSWVRRAATGGDRAARHPILRAIGWLAHPAGARLAAHPTLERAVARFVSEWSRLVAQLTRYRAGRTLHLGAAMFALGMIAGLLARARYAAEYAAGWAGTWAGAEAEIAAFLGVVLGPAAAMTGKALPTVERLRALRGGAENAGDWVILWAVTAVLFVVVPRLLLALVSGVRVGVLKRRLPVDEDFYVRSVVRNALGRARSVRVIPYGIELDGEARRRLERLLTGALGEKAQVRSDATVRYGEEDDWLDREGRQLADADQLVLLFNLGSTPEAENHGAFVQGVRQRVGRTAEIMVLLDDSGFRHRLRGQPSAQQRIEERLQAWRVVLEPAMVDPFVASLASDDEAGGARALEQAMLRTPSRT